jgi:hypothetical protein
MLHWYQATGAEARDGRPLRNDEAHPASERVNPRRRVHRAQGAARLGEGGQCEARQVLRDARASLRRMLSAEALQGGQGKDYESAALGYVDED